MMTLFYSHVINKALLLLLVLLRLWCCVRVLCQQVEIWVLLSRSGRAAFSNAERGAPYWALGERLSGVPWPLPPAWALADDSAAAG